MGWLIDDVDWVVGINVQRGSALCHLAGLEWQACAVRIIGPEIPLSTSGTYVAQPMLQIHNRGRRA